MDKDKFLDTPILKKFQLEINDVYEVKKINETFKLTNSQLSNKKIDNQQQQQQLLKPKRIDKYQKSLVNVEKQIALETKDELLEIERDFDEVTDMFKDFNQEIKQQGETLKVINKKMVETNDNVELGINELKKARKYQRTFGLGL